MLDYLRNLTKSKEEKRQEALNAYLDDVLAPGQRQQVESDLAHDAGQRAELDQMLLLQQQMRQLPQRRVRRNFTLDPALYGRPQREPLIQAYPALRTATVLAAFVFIFAIAANLFLNGSAGMMSGAEPVALQAESHEAVIAEAVVEEVEADSMAMDAASMEEAGADSMAMDAASMEEAEADSMVMGAELIEEAAEAPLIAEEIAVNPEFEMPADEAELALEQVEMGSEAAVPMESEEPPEEPKAVSPVENGALAVMPTMVAEETAGAELAVELQSAPRAVATESTEQPGSRLAEVTAAGEEVSGGVGEIQAQGDDGSFWTNRLGLFVLLLGIVLVVLIVMTLLARRRL
jgi:hypothetical protein